MIDISPNLAAEIPLLETKLYLPRWRSDLVSRPRLVARLGQGAEGRLTLISAPPGFGKTTLLAEWLAGTEGGRLSTGWVSLDRGDDDPVLFWTYVVTALQRVRPGVGAGALAMLQSPQPPAIEAVLTTLINEIDRVEADTALVLDDLHLIQTAPIHEALAFLLEHLPPRLHLVIASRSDAAFPLARMRARGELTELRAADLRFTRDEAGAFLNRAMKLGLRPADVTALEERTEGWIAGLKLAALSMQGREDARGFLEAFAGDNRYITDYLVEEVIQRQPAAVRRFLLQTSVLGRLSGPLCDAVTDGETASDLLETLERGNLFVVPLDDQRRWYRYHHLFADVLQAQAQKEDPDLVRTLHRRASAWYEQNRIPADAIRHSLAAGDLERAAGLIEIAWPAAEATYQFATWLAWVRQLPDEMVRARPVLSLGYAWMLLNVGEMEPGEARLRDVERWMEKSADHGGGRTSRPDGMVVVDEAQFRALPVKLATARTYLAQSLGDIAATVSSARQLLELVPEGNHEARAPALALLGLAFWASGDLEAAVQTYSAGMASLRRAGDLTSAIGGSKWLGDMQVAQGRLREAAATYEDALTRAAEQSPPVFAGVVELHLGLAELFIEWGDLEAADRYLHSAAEAGADAVHPGNLHRLNSAEARVRASRGDLVGAIALIDEAERHHIRSPLPDLKPVAAVKARMLIVQGKLAQAEAWADERRVSADDEPAYLREFEHLTLVRVLLARHAAGRGDGPLQGALGLLQRLLSVAEERERIGSVIEILMLQALALQAGGDTLRADAALKRALALAAPEGFQALFVDEREPMRNLLRSACAHGADDEYCRHLLAAFDVPASAVSPTAPPTGGALVRPLTPREVEIMRLVAAGKRNEEIATQLFLSPATVKRHVANVYGKLDVTHRTAAVARASELKLL